MKKAAFLEAPPKKSVDATKDKKHGMQMGASGFGLTHGCGCGNKKCRGCEAGRHTDR